HPADPGLHPGGAPARAARAELARAGRQRPLRAAARERDDEGAVPEALADEGVEGEPGAQEPGARERDRKTRAQRRAERPTAGAGRDVAAQRRRTPRLPRRGRGRGRDPGADEPPAAAPGPEAQEAAVAKGSSARRRSSGAWRAAANDAPSVRAYPRASGARSAGRRRPRATSIRS